MDQTTAAQHPVEQVKHSRQSETVQEAVDSARVYSEINDNRKPGDTSVDSTQRESDTRSGDGHLNYGNLGKRDKEEKGLISMQLDEDGGNHSSFYSNKRTDKLLYKHGIETGEGRDSLEVFRGRSDGIVQQAKTERRDGTVDQKTEFQPELRPDGLMNETFQKGKGEELQVARTFDPELSPEKMSHEYIHQTRAGVTTLRSFEGRVDGLVSENELTGSDGTGSKTFTYENGETVTLQTDSKAAHKPGSADNDTTVGSLSVAGGELTGQENRDGAEEQIGQVTDKGTDASDKAQTRDSLTKTVAPEDFSRVAKEVLQRIDVNKTGKVTKQQLAAALEDPSFTGQHAQALAALYKNYDNLANLSGQQGAFESKGISTGDLDSYDQNRQEAQQKRLDSTSMKVWGEINLSRFASNGKELTSADVDKALKDPSTTEYDKQMLGLIQKNFTNIVGRYSGDITQERLNSYSENQWRSPQAGLEGDINYRMHRVNRAQDPANKRDLYADKANPLASIKPDAVEQGAIGNCYFVSALASVAQSNPELIRNAIKDNGDGTYTVTFPGARDYPVTVKAPTEAEQGLYNAGGQHGLWASVMEKAHGEFYNQGLMAKVLGRSWTPTEGADGGGIPGNAIALLTGQSYESFSTTFNSQQSIADQLSRAFADNPPRAIVAGTNRSLFSENTEGGFARGHAYSITGFESDGNGGGMVTIRNPWNHGQGTGGTIKIPLSVFMKNFGDIQVERRK
jgi:hypothetical protein